MNIIAAPNESGKSTLCAFLVTMLYGVNTRERDKREHVAEKNRYKPWSGAPMEGELTCDYGKRKIILRRSSENGLPMGVFSATDALTGETIPELTGSNAGEQLTGITREVFERSLLFRQNQLKVSSTGELEEKIAALVSTGDDQQSFSQTEEKLKLWQRQLRYNKTGELPRLEEEEMALIDQLDKLTKLWDTQLELSHVITTQEHRYSQVLSHESDMEKASSSVILEELSKAEGAYRLESQKLQVLLDQDPRRLERQQESDEKEKASLLFDLEKLKRKSIGSAIFWLILMALGALPFLFPQYIPEFILPYRAFIPALPALILLISQLYYRQSRHGTERFLAILEKDMGNYKNLVAERELHIIQRREAVANCLAEVNAQKERYAQSKLPSEEAQALSQKIQQAQQQRAVLLGRLQELGNIDKLKEALSKNQEEQKKCKTEFDAITLALDTLYKAEEKLRSRFSPSLNAKASYFFQRLTGGKYQSLAFDKEFSPKAKEEGKLSLISGSYLSQGTLDQLYFSLRLAICDLVLPQNERLPLILDDAFSAFDKKRLSLALDLLKDIADQRQVLLFSCQERELSYFKNEDKVHRQSLDKS